jgi:ATP-dependent DNA ligase
LLDENGIPNFEWMRSRAVRKRGELVTYFAFDLLFLNGRDLRLHRQRNRQGSATLNRRISMTSCERAPCFRLF